MTRGKSHKSGQISIIPTPELREFVFSGGIHFQITTIGGDQPATNSVTI